MNKWIKSLILISFILNLTAVNAQSTGCSNQNVETDPRVPPAGSYVVNTGNGNANQVYTTGETKPYIVDNSCNNQVQQPVVQPYIGTPLPPGPAPTPIRR